MLVAPALEEIEAAGERVARQHAERRCRGPPIHGRREQPDARIAAVQVPLDSPREIVGGRLDLVAVACPRHGIEHGGTLAGGERVEHADRPAAGRAAGELRGTEDRGALRNVLEGAARRGLALRGPPNPARVEVQRRVTEADHPAAVPAEIEDLRALDEKRPMLVEELLKGREVHERLVDLHLPEVGVHRHVERLAGAHPVLQIRAHTALVRARRLKGVAAPRRLAVRPSPDGVGQDLDVLAGLHAREPDKAREARGHTALGPGHEWKERQLVLALDPADKAHAPYLVRDAGEPQLGKRDADLRRPAERVHSGRGLPHGVPRLVGEGAVATVEHVGADPRGADCELERRAVIVIAVQQHPELVAVRRGVAPREPPHDLAGLGVEQPGADVQGVRVVHDPHLRRFRHGPALVRNALEQVAHRRHLGPGGIVEAAVDHGGHAAARHAHRLHHRRGRRWRYGVDRLECGEQSRQGHHARAAGSREDAAA